MQHRTATLVSPRRSAATDRPRHHRTFLLALLLLVPACGGDAPAPAPAVADSPDEPTAIPTSLQAPEEEVTESEEPALQAPPPAPASVPANAPALDTATREAATTTLQPIQGLLKDLLARYAAAMEAKRKGDDEAWRTAMDEAVALGYEVQDLWNEVVGAMPANEEFDEEQTAAIHFPAGHSAVVDTLDALRNIERQRGR